VISINDVPAAVTGDENPNQDGHFGGTSYRVINKNTVGTEALRVIVQTWPVGGYTTGHPIHDDREQCYYVLEGTMNINIDGVEHVAPAGSFVYIPRGCEHNHRNEGPEVLKFITINCPVRSGDVPPLPESKE
ncbi:MAG: cupin domain-containing protein, partial [Planctomycetaceae bacterium]